MTTATLLQKSRPLSLAQELTRIAVGLALAIVSGLLLLWSFPPVGLWPLVFVAVVPMLIAQYRVLPRRWSALAPATTALVMSWLFVLGKLFPPEMQEAIPFLRVIPLIAAVQAFLPALLYRPFHERTNFRWFVVVGVAEALAFAGLANIDDTSGTWAMMANVLFEQTWLIQPVAVFGIFGLEALIALVAFTTALWALRLVDRIWTFDDAHPIHLSLARHWTIGAGLVVLLWVGGSLVTWATAPDPENADNRVRVAALQPNPWPLVRDGEPFVEVDGERLTDPTQILFAQTRSAAEQGAQVIAWPEGALDFDPQAENREQFSALARETGAYLAIGYAYMTGEGLVNEAALISPEGEFLGKYGKDHPVSFAGETSVTRGTYPVYETPLGVMATAICYDLDFTDTSRKLAAQGAQLLLTPSNDWPAIADQHYTHSVFRAIENRAAVVKAESAYNAAIIDPYGRILAHTVTPEGARAILVADVALVDATTVYTRVGDLLAWAGMGAFALSLLAMIAVLLRRRQGQAD